MEQSEAAGTSEKEAMFSHRRLEYASFLAQIISSAAVVISLIFVGIQLNENTKIAIREESNATMSQWTAFRNSVYSDRNTAELFYDGLEGTRALDGADQLRFGYIFREHAWATFQIWDRAKGGLVPASNFTDGAGPDFLRVICTPGGSRAWSQVKPELPEGYVADMDRLTAPFEARYSVQCDPVPAGDEVPSHD